MLLYIALALLNGICIGVSRSINGQLATRLGSMKSSLWNHLVGFLFLTAALAVMTEWPLDAALTAPPAAYVGGAIGALFVAINSYIFPRLGAMHALLLVISGQMVTAVAIDTLHHGELPTIMRCLGVVLVLFGISLRRLIAPRRADSGGAPPAQPQR